MPSWRNLAPVRCPGASRTPSSRATPGSRPPRSPRERRPDRPFVDAARAQKIAAKLDGAALLAALDAPDATDDSRFEAIRKYADDLYDAIKAEFPGKSELGSDEFLPVLSLVRTLLIGSVPGLGAALERLSNDPFALRVGPHFQQEEHYDHPLRATVASTLF